MLSSTIAATAAAPLYPGEFRGHATGSPGAVAIADLDLDGARELVVATHGPLRVLRFDAAGELLSSAAFGSVTAPADAVVADLSGDGSPDVAVTSPSLDALVVFLGAEGGALGPQASCPAGDQPGALALGDLDGDGDPRRGRWHVCNSSPLLDRPQERQRVRDPIPDRAGTDADPPERDGRARATGAIARLQGAGTR
jgi:hypothetical protein